MALEAAQREIDKARRKLYDYVAKTNREEQKLRADLCAKEETKHSLLKRFDTESGSPGGKNDGPIHGTFGTNGKK